MLGGLLLVLAGLFALNVVLVLVFGLVIDVRRRRERREVTQLERLWRSPAASIRSLGERSHTARVHGKHVSVLDAPPRGGLGTARAGGKHVSAQDQDAASRGGLGTISLAVTALAVLSVLVAAVLDPSGGPSHPRAIGGDTSPGSFFGRELGPQGPPSADRSDGGTASPTGAEADRGTPSGAQVGSQTPTGATSEADGEAQKVASAVAAMAASSSSIRLTWNSVPEATGYKVERRDGPSETDPWRNVGETAPEVATFTDTGLAADTTYFYRVRAVLEDGEAPTTSDVVSATTTATSPPAASTLTAKVRRSGIILAWSDVEDEIGYRIERQTQDGTDWIAIGTTGAGVVQYKDANLSPGATYRYRVIAIGPGGESAPSNVVEATASIGVDEGPPGHSDDDVSTEPSEQGSEALHEDAAAS